MKATRKKPARKPTLAERALAKRKADAVAKAYSKMTPAERRKLIKDIGRSSLLQAPTIAAAKSDLLKLLNAVGAEFVRRYYPDVTDACFYASKYANKPHGGPEYTVNLPIAVPTA